MTNKKAKWDREGNLDRLLQLLKEKKELTFKKLKDELKVSDPTLTEYVKALEGQGKIEHFDKPGDRRSQWYRIKPEKENEVHSQIGKYEALSFIKSIHNPIYSYRSSEQGKSVAIFCGALDTVKRQTQQEALEKIIRGFPLGLVKLPRVPGQKIAVVIMSAEQSETKD